MKNLEVPKLYSIKTTPKETLEKWLHLLILGRAIDNKAPNYLKQAIGWSIPCTLRRARWNPTGNGTAF